MIQCNVFMFPGQGSQTEKMGYELWEKHDSAKQLFNLASEIYGEDLVELCYNSPFSVMKRTDHAQMALATISILCYDLLCEQNIRPSLVMGHSAGESAALYASGILSKEDALRLACYRGKAMYSAASNHPGKMVAVLGAFVEDIRNIIQEVKQENEVLDISNYNSPNETVVSGDTEAVTRFQNELRQRKLGRCIDLKQQGAWHSLHMLEAKKQFAESIKKIEFRTPRTPMIFNYDAAFADKPHKIRENVINLLASSVRWTECVDNLIPYLSKNAVFYEVGPNKILGGLLKQCLQHKNIDFSYFETLGKN